MGVGEVVLLSVAIVCITVVVIFVILGVIMHKMWKGTR